MENTKLPLVKWFLALHFTATNKDGISEMALAKYIGVTLKTSWSLLHKIRSVMGGAMPFTGLAAPLKWMRHFSVGKPKENGAGAAAIKLRWLPTVPENASYSRYKR